MQIRKIKKLEIQINQWSCINIFYKKNSNASFFPIGSCCQFMAVTSFFPNGCMKWQHAVILESIWETDLIITHFPASRTGLLTPRLTCLTLLFFSLLLGQIILSPTPFLPFTSLDKNFLSPTPLLSSFWRKYSKTIPISVLAAISLPIRKNILRQFQFLS